MEPTPLFVMEFLLQWREPLIWLAIAAFLTASLLDVGSYRSAAVWLAGGGWILFGLFWIAMFPYFYFEFGSPLEGLLSLIGGPLSFYTGYLLVSGRDSLLILSRAVGLMGVFYLPASLLDPVRHWLIETVAIQTHWGMELLGYSPGLVEGPNDLMSQFDFPVTDEGRPTYIEFACTGIGSISIFGGLVAAARGPLSQKVLAFVSATGVIWVLNLARNVFVSLAAPLGWFHEPILVSVTTTVSPAMAPAQTSYFMSHHLVAQPLSLVALLGITLLVVRILPAAMHPIEELLYVLTGIEYDLQTVFSDPVRTDGGN